MGHFGRLLEGMAANPERRLRDIPMLAPEERSLLVEGWNRTDQPGPGGCAQQLFEQGAERRPEALAVRCGDRQLSYGELETRANRVAWGLRGLGVGPEVPVGLLVERTEALVVAQLGVLKAGGAYVPLEPGLPGERLRWVLHDVGAPLLLTDADAPDLDGAAPAVVRLRDLERLARTDRPPATAAAGNLAYVIYTSGSTGRPKGVAVEHRSVVNLVSRPGRVHHVAEGERTAQIANPGFDAAVWEVWAALAGGGSVHIPESHLRLEPERLVRWMSEEGITVSFLTTGLGELLLDQPWPPECRLRALLLGGEQVHPVRRGDLPFQVHDVYGPTETTVFATSFDLTGERGTPPIGTPLANVRTYVLDGQMEPVPAGVPGELYIGGAGLARGYVGQPPRTADRFVPDPFAPAPGGRLYRTGDVVVRREDGALQYLGRSDHQLKVRGFRIEPGEIESALTDHPGVAAAVVVSRGERASDRRLLAYLVPRPGTRPEPGDLRRHLSRLLPEYMLPADYVLLDALPLTPNGKVDRRALPEPAPPAPAAGREVPTTATERRLVAIWAEALGRAPDAIGVHDDFFQLGGHSLLAVQVVLRVNRALGAALRLRDLFRTPTIAALAAAVDGSGPATAEPPIPTLDRGRRGAH
jgi:amino acid adenylation domain-containing protein